MSKVVGISQKIKRVWLDLLLDELARTKEEPALRSLLDDQLKQELPGKESRAKAAGIILQIWSPVSSERVSVRDRAVELLPRISGRERIWLHWGMTSLAYPFFRDVAEIVGRLSTLQDDFSTAQVQNRMVTNWGDRTTTKEAVQKLITSMLDWGVLRSAKNKGHFLLSSKITTANIELQFWLLEVQLKSSAADEIELQHLLRQPSLFPFAFSIGPGDLRKCESFNIHRQGLDTDIVSLTNAKQRGNTNPVRKLGRAAAVGQTQLDFSSPRGKS